MEIILNYLDSMFATLPDTEEVRRAKIEMASMMEDKYLELKLLGKSENEAIGIVISEFGSMDEIVREMGLEDGAKKESERYDENSRMKAAAKPVKKVSIKYAEEYIEFMKRFGRSIGFGVFLCICSPILLVFTGTIDSENRLFQAIGLIAMFGLIAVGVVIFIINGISMSRYDDLEKEVFELEAGAKLTIERWHKEVRPVFGRQLAIGVALVIIGIIPVSVVPIVWGEDALMAIGMATCLLLFLVAIGVYIIVSSAIPYGCFNVLLQKEEHSVRFKESKPLTGKIAGIYWPVVTVIFLAWSFIGNDWGRSWIIWPIAGVLFASIDGIINATHREE